MDRATTPAAKEPEILYSEIQAAPFFGLSAATLRKMRCVGAGPSFVKLGKAVRYRKSDIDEYVAARVVRPG